MGLGVRLRLRNLKGLPNDMECGSLHSLHAAFFDIRAAFP